MSADVRSIAAVIDWHAALTNYGESLGEALAGVDLEIRRAYEWLDEQRGRWQRAVRECEDEVTRAKAELAQRKFATWDDRQPDTTVQEKALRVARARLEFAEEKVEALRRWAARLPKLVDEVYTGPSQRLKNRLEADLPNALAGLKRRIAALEGYAGLRPDFAPAPSASPPTPPAPLPEGKGEEEPPDPVSSNNAQDATESVTPLPLNLREGGHGGVGSSGGAS